MESPVAQALTKQLTEEPDNWDVRCRLAEQLVMEGRRAEAVTVLDAAEDLPQYEDHILKAAEIYASHDPKRAVPLLHAFLTECPDNALGHLAMADTAGKLGDITGATQYYEVALRLNKAYRDPDFEDKYGIVVENAPPALTAKTATVPLGVEAKDSESTEPLADTEPPEVAHLPKPKAVEVGGEEEAEATKATGRKSKEGKGFGCAVMALTAIGVFLLGWLITIFVMKGMLSQG